MSAVRSVVLGIGRYGSGAYTACQLARCGRRVRLVDAAPARQFDERLLQMAAAYGVGVVCGGNPLWLLGEASELYVAPSVPPAHPYVRTARERNLPVRIDIELLLPLVSGMTLVVTGSNGKTTTAAWLHRMLSTGAVLAGNVGVPAARVLLTQGAPSGPLVLEVSSFQGRYLAANGTGYDVLAVTNFSANHLDAHADLEDYRRSKRQLVPLARRAVVLNHDDAEVAAWAALANGRVVFFGTSAPAPAVRLDGDKIVWAAEDAGREALADAAALALPGRHNLYNYMAAAAAALAAGAPLDAVRKAAGSFEGLEHRLQPVAEVNGVRFYDDSASTCPESTLAALETFAGNAVLIVGGRNKGFDVLALAAGLSRAAGVVLIGETGRELHRLLGGPATLAASMREAVQAAYELALRRRLPVVLSPGFASFDMFADYRRRAAVFVEALKRLTPGSKV